MQSGWLTGEAEDALGPGVEGDADDEEDDQDEDDHADHGAGPEGLWKGKFMVTSDRKGSFPLWLLALRLRLEVLWFCFLLDQEQSW